MTSVITGLEEAKNRAGKAKPVVILLHTEMGSGVDFMMGTHKMARGCSERRAIRIRIESTATNTRRLLI